MAARKGSNTVTVMEDTSIDRLVARGISKLAPLAPPWLLTAPAAIGGAIFHAMWGSTVTAPWAAVGMTAGTFVLTGLTYVVSHERRKWLGRLHNTVTTLAAGGWMTAATITGVTAPGTESMLIGGGAFLAISWNIRHVIRNVQGDEPTGDTLNAIFNKTKENFGLDGAKVHTKKIGPHKVEAQLELPSGEKSVEDVQKKVEYMEGGMGLPPGSIGIAPNEDRADWAKVTFSDPRVMKKPIPFPGPSLVGKSIADPIRPGLWQDLDEVEYVMAGHHLQVMGMTGAGKSIGGAWNILAELMTRKDVAIFAADITKGEQTLGPLRPALHRFETTELGVKKMIGEMHAQMKPRTDWLSRHGYQKWQKGCGLQYWLLWLEECPDIFDAIDMDTFMKFLKAVRSAGGTVVMSLQRSDYTQMPTLARGQLAKMCFGVAESDDADFGLSEQQQKRGARPELWQQKQPGMAYLDAPSIPDERIAMPLRTFAWSETGDDNEANERMTAYAAQWPAADKQADEFTRAVMTPGGAGTAQAQTPPASFGAALINQDDDTDEEVEDVVGEYLRTEDPNPENQATADDEIKADGYEEFEFVQPASDDLSPEEAQALLYGTIDDWASAGREFFQTKDLAPVWMQAGMTRQWAQRHVRKMLADGSLDRDDQGRYVIIRTMAGV
jgi:hypothetical protein